MNSFLEKLAECSSRNDSLLCVGLDIDLSLTPPGIVGFADSLVAFNQALIEATSDLVCAYKPNLAFYEALGLDGIEALRRTVKSVPDGIPVIGDAKRCDVGHSARAYAEALFEFFGFDAATVSPFLGKDAVQPFIEYRRQGIFFLCKTSNIGSDDFQNLLVIDANGSPAEPLYLNIARRIREWNVFDNCGLVVGATFPKELRDVRAIAEDMPILIPGVGAQGGDLEMAVKYGVDRNGGMAIINSSRQIIYASRNEDFAAAARKAALELRDAINKARRPKQSSSAHGDGD